MVTMLLTSQKALLLFITFILLQYDTECRKSLLNVEDPETWRKLADEKFNKFEKSLYYSLTKRPKNVIIFIGDGMSLNTVTGARYLKAENMDLLGGDVQLVWDDWPVASLVRTFNSDRLTTDSGSAATAFLSGAKGPDGTVGITGTVKCCKCTELRDLERAKSSLKYASNAGLSTGIVTTTRVTHATPAAAYANLLHRNWESNAEISDSGFNCSDAAAQLIANASDINVVMGGGAAEFYGTLETLAFNTKGKRHDSRNLLLEWEEIQKKMSRKYAVIHTNDDFKRTDWASVDYVLGLFAPSHLAYRLENRDEPTLSDMTEAAIKILSHNNKGFLLLVEGGRIDHGHHISQAKNALTETLEMEKAIEKALSLVNKKETLIIVTADHSHVYGVVGYPTRNISVLDVDNTDKGKDNKSYLISAHYNGPRGLVNEIRSDPATENTFANNYTAQSLVRLPFSTHSAEDVPIYANGPYSELFHSSMDNTFIAHAIMYSLCIGPYTHHSHCVSKPTSGTQLTGFRQHSYHYVVFLCILLYNFLH